MLCWPRVFVPKRWIILLMDTTVRQWTGDWACHLIIWCFSCFWINREKTYHYCSVAQSRPICNHMDCSMPGFIVLHHLLEFAQIHAHWVSDAIQPSCSLFSSSPPAFNLFPIRVFYESALCITWPKYCSCSFSINPSNEYSGLISFRIDWFNLLGVQGTLKCLL